ncbi:hypothetical protein ACFORH_00415 [Amycolatopsis roodepoortensis]|uniref:Uncharacterized protein n=1 Tax=Amycolatopsis roodepoortensis TaxID=700274 RepID=A0ABR9L411_9PSEU|nr:hypothetical protein [Amycolatopsis roodepoortensis]MBE1575453.1 hypothetical protein [Amycolatopsis roodepoortensis]
MATLLRHFADQFELDYSTLFIEDDAVDHDIVPPTSGGWLTATEQQVTVSSASGTTSVPEALLEYWDGEPPQPGPDWVNSSEALAWFSTGRLSIWRTIREHSLGHFELGGPGLYRVRAHTGDRHEVRQATDKASRQNDEGSGTRTTQVVERFLIRFWPAPSSDTRDMVEAPGSIYPEHSEQNMLAQAIRTIGTSDFAEAVERTERVNRGPGQHRK